MTDPSPIVQHWKGLVDKTCRDTVYITPEIILDKVRDYFKGPIDLDPATEPNNPTRARAFFTGPHNGGVDGLIAHWSGNVFVNPPYGRELKPWVEKIGEEAQSLELPHIVALLPGQRFETPWFQDHILCNYHLTSIVFVRRRVSFLRPNGKRAKGNPYGSMIYIFNGHRSAKTVFAPLGTVGSLSDVQPYNPGQPPEFPYFTCQECRRTVHEDNGDGDQCDTCKGKGSVV